MDTLQKILTLTEDEKVKYGINLPEKLHTKLVLGQTRYVCRYGTLSEGHEKLTDAQKYYQAIKEMYYLSVNMQQTQASAMEAKANILDAQDRVKSAVTEADELRAQAHLLRARSALMDALTSVQDQYRMIDEYDKIRQELEAGVERRYPEGIEQAERDNWSAVAKYRLLKEQTPGLATETMSNIPLDPITKANLGVEFKRIDMIAPLIIANESTFEQIANEDPDKLTKFLDSVAPEPRLSQIGVQ